MDAQIKSKKLQLLCWVCIGWGNIYARKYNPRSFFTLTQNKLEKIESAFKRSLCNFSAMERTVDVQNKSGNSSMQFAPPNEKT
jgi:hypothetical protein